MTGKTWLLKWNPTLPERAAGDLERLESIRPGAEIEWPCVGDPAPGDRVFMLRLGRDEPGLMAAGIVTRGSLSGPDWHYPATKTHYFLRFQVEDVRHSCAEGFLPRLMLEKLLPGQRWSLIHDAGEIQASIAKPLEQLWGLAKGRHSLAACVDALRDRRGPGHRKWLDNYQALVRKVEPVRKEGAELTAELLAELWRAQRNGITGVGSGVLPGVEFEQNEAVLREFTAEALRDPSAETLRHVWDAWSARQRAGDFSKRRLHVIHRVFAAIAPERYTSLLNPDDLHKLQEGLAKHFQLPSPLEGNWATRNAAVQAVTLQAGLDSLRCVENNVAMWELFEWFDVQKPKAEDAAFLEEAGSDNDTKEAPVACNIPVNQILFGPPGTGKTFETINASLEILAPEMLTKHLGNRKELKRAFDAFVEAGQIVFCTFHQSFSYEEFVQGIGAETVSGQVQYNVRDGIFKQICDRARSGTTEHNDAFDKALDLFKQAVAEAEEPGLVLRTIKGKEFRVEASGGSSALAFPASSVDQKHDYFILFKDVRRLYEGADKKDIANNPSYVWGVLDYLYQECGLPPFSAKGETDPSKAKFVLIIDEINRGNTSRIFGELITLIESSKRAGQPEALSVILPYSKERFSVPSNLYLIGTMNTADRSLAGLDLALRRRFTFREMPPRPDLLEGVTVEGVDIGRLLAVLNERIDIILDRDNRIGHAYFMDLEGDEGKRTLLYLAEIFREKILPLLQEYFFEDWQRIQWVLNDHRKQVSDCFVYQRTLDATGLFGAGVDLPKHSLPWCINEEAFERPEAYRGIIDAQVVASQIVEQEVEYGGYTVKRLASGSIQVWRAGKCEPVVKPVLRELAAELDVELVNEQGTLLNTRQLGMRVLSAMAVHKA